LLCLAFAVSTLAMVSYDGAQLLNCQIPEELKSSFYTVIEDVNAIDVWGFSADGSADILAKNAREKLIIDNFFGNASLCTVKTANVGDSIRQFDALQANASLSAEWFDAYHTYSEIVTWWSDFVTKWASTYYPTPIMTYISTIGSSVEGRAMPAVYINYKDTQKPVFYHQCLIHAREWISGATCQFVFNSLLDDFRAGRTDAVNALTNYNHFIVPVVNPDGYTYTWTNDRLWRKNRRAGSCYGTDVNRNFNDHWGQGGSSTNPCSDTYMGPSVASEPETKNIQNRWAAVQKADPYIIMGIDWHSYSQLVLRPYGWTNNVSPHEAQQKTIGDGIAAAIKGIHGKTYTSQRSYQLYQTTGSTSDYFYGTGSANNVNGGVYAAGFTIELRPENEAGGGFQLPPAFIIPTGQESYAGYLSAINYFLKNGALK